MWPLPHTVIMGIPSHATLLVIIFVALGGHKQGSKCNYRFPDLLLPQQQLLVTKCYPEQGGFLYLCVMLLLLVSWLLEPCPSHPDVQQDSQTQHVQLGLSCHKVPVFQSSNCTVSLPSECFAGLFSPLRVPREALLLLNAD